MSEQPEICDQLLRTSLTFFNCSSDKFSSSTETPKSSFTKVVGTFSDFCVEAGVHESPTEALFKEESNDFVCVGRWCIFIAWVDKLHTLTGTRLTWRLKRNNSRTNI